MSDSLAALAPRPDLMFDLVAKLPENGAVWSEESRVKWLQAAAAIFDVVYQRPEGDTQHIAIAGAEPDE